MMPLDAQLLPQGCISIYDKYIINMAHVLSKLCNNMATFVVCGWLMRYETTPTSIQSSSNHTSKTQDITKIMNDSVSNDDEILNVGPNM